MFITFINKKNTETFEDINEVINRRTLKKDRQCNGYGQQKKKTKDLQSTIQKTIYWITIYHPAHFAGLI